MTVAARFQASTFQVAVRISAGLGIQRVENALQSGRDAFVLLVAGLGRAAEAEQEEMLALDIREHKSA